jgi:hypothetical protein
MPDPAPVLCIAGVPFILAIVESTRSRSALRRSVSSAGGDWSESLGIDRPAQMPARRQ